MAAGITTKERLERLMAAKAQLEAQISKHGQILAAVSKVAHSCPYPMRMVGYISYAIRLSGGKGDLERVKPKNSTSELARDWELGAKSH